ncbi:hypothetical protein FB471_4868 [Amycolatopsis cihanbeyliensis]|uniref:Uncharacterized protein n=2 Tax=Amycolatopsis cihanbeyliensis TaxID=1128664 RepID=A0A542DPQ8_AMYCI|nr:hypothetical protein FB471_4868 [Amycolatopsis cihanbeyliensis]
MHGAKREADEVRAYVESQAAEEVVHLEKAASELVGPVRHDIWDVHGTASRWWVVTNPTNLYDQADFKSRDVVLTFHIGLALRIEYGQERTVPVTPESAELLRGSWRRWQQAFEAYDSTDEAEAFQSVGVRIRERLVSFVGETRDGELVPDGQTPPKTADVKGWTELLANRLAAGESAARLRSYLKKLAVETWEYVNWLTHAKNAVRMDAESGSRPPSTCSACTQRRGSGWRACRGVARRAAHTRWWQGCAGTVRGPIRRTSHLKHRRCPRRSGRVGWCSPARPPPTSRRSRAPTTSDNRSRGNLSQCPPAPSATLAAS